MKSITHNRMMLTTVLVAALLVGTGVDSPSPKETQHSFDAPNKLKVTIKMIAPYAQQTDLQIVCVFKHNPAGDKYVASMKDFNDKLGGLLSSLRNRGEFVGELGETILFNPPAGTITPKRVLVIGLGPEKDLSLDTLRVVGRVALREAVRLKVTEVSFAPTIRDQGNSAIDVGDGDRAVIEEVILAYDTEKRLQAQGLADPFDLREWLIEAGPAYVDSAIEKTKLGIDEAARRIKERESSPYRHTH